MASTEVEAMRSQSYPTSIAIILRCVPLVFLSFTLSVIALAQSRRSSTRSEVRASVLASTRASERDVEQADRRVELEIRATQARV